MSNQNSNSPICTRVSFALMALIVVGCVLTIAVIVALSSLESWLVILAVIATLAIASNQVVYNVADIAPNRHCNKDEVAKILTRCLSPLAVVVIALVVTEPDHFWHLFGFAPLVGISLLRYGNRSQQ